MMGVIFIGIGLVLGIIIWIFYTKKSLDSSGQNWLFKNQLSQLTAIIFLIIIAVLIYLFAILTR